MRQEIAVVGRSCRLPGAPSVSRLWDLLESGRCSVSRIPADRWSQGRFGHPRPKERGRSYTWAAGVLDDIWGFDPAVFRISPREAEQIDPQQRLLLELVFEACEDAGVPPSHLGGSDAGVYVGASALDYSTIALHDPALADAYFATGNTLSIISNRISYIFDLHGPSLTIDTACSSSLVALHEACQALSRGEIDAAIVGGVNILASPFGFVSFSQATMLSPTGLCHAFSAAADGYVRSEGGVVLILKPLDRAIANGDRIHAVICGSGVNTDGRTSGISLPAEAFQARLMRSLYDRAGVAPDSVAYVEAHGTGTQAGDPIEAAALGTVLGRGRKTPLPMGSIKTNIGHLEPASGLAGLLKAMLALEHDRAPKSLHFESPNPEIDFAGLNLSVTKEATPLPRMRDRRFVGVSSFGFGGTNAHVIIADPPKLGPREASTPRYLLLTAQTQPGLRALAESYAARLTGLDEDDGRHVVAATAYRRERMPERLILPVDDPKALPANLMRFAESGRTDASAARGTTIDGDRSVVFVFSGNGSQWEGMGRAALASSPVFRKALKDVDSHFISLAGWSLEAKLASPDLARDLEKTSVAQPLIFAIQAASGRALAELGLRPSLTIGHSVGEVAAAEAAGALSLADAVKVIVHRSRHQELAENRGGMAAIIGPREVAISMVQEIPQLTIAAYNSYRCVVAAGSLKALEALAKRTKESPQLRVQRLDLAYPFHTSLMEPAKRPLLESLADLAPSAGETPFLSTIANAILPGASLDAHYWWRNVREPVLFQEGVERALEIGKRVFLEIGPRSMLRVHLRDSIDHADVFAITDSVFEEGREIPVADPFEGCAMRLLAAGAQIDPSRAFGLDPGAGVDLPPYPWRRVNYRLGKTTEATSAFSARAWHPLIGARVNVDTLEWGTNLDPELEPALADHRLREQTLLPGAAFVEMALAIARDWKNSNAVALVDLEILRPLIFTPNASREILCRISAPTSTFEILSRPRLSESAFVFHARGGIIDKLGAVESVLEPVEIEGAWDSEALYSRAQECGLEFGPAYRQLARARRTGDAIEVELTAQRGDARYALDPSRLDSCFHGLILIFSDLGRESAAYLPVRFDEVRLIRADARLARARLRIRRADERAVKTDIELFDDMGRLIGLLRGARFQSARSKAGPTLSQIGLVQAWIPATAELSGNAVALQVDAASPSQPRREAELPKDGVLIEGWASAAAQQLARDLSTDGVLDVDELIMSGRLPGENRRWAEAVFGALQASGLLTREGSSYRLTDQEMPSAESVLTTLAWRHPERAPEQVLAAHVGAMLRAFGDGRGALAPVSDAARDAFDLRSEQAAATAKALSECLDRMTNAMKNRPAPRILQIDYGPSTASLARFAAHRSARLTLFDSDGRRLERARRRFGQSLEISFCADLDGLANHSFDLVLSAGGLSRLCAQRGALECLTAKCDPKARIVALEPAPSLFQDLVFGLDAKWFGDEDARLRSAEGWRSLLTKSGLCSVRAELAAQVSDAAVELVAEAPRAAIKPQRVGAAVDILIVHGSSRRDAFANALKQNLIRRGARCRVAEQHDAAALAGERPDILVWLAADQRGDSVKQVTRQCLALKTLLLALGPSKLHLFVAIDASNRPVADAAASFLRTLANEAPALDVHRVEILTPAPDVADQLARIIVSGTDETDIAIRGDRVEVLRFAPPKLSQTTPAAGEARRLEKSAEAGLDCLAWKACARVAPKVGQVEVEVIATGLNFRDVMCALSALPDEMLEDGFAGPTLGLEFSGRVAAVGPGVERLQVGDKVLGFCGAAFSSHVTVDVDHVAPLPSRLSSEAAATIPVTFLTAYYGLIACADLKPGEWALIHGGAGGVGLAALQIALWRGARPIVTAGSQEKRDLTLALGAEYAFDSRSGGFVDDVMRVTEGRGVSVVLNSFAGEAMERSIGLLGPFGRFVELGKRDYLANTPIGLRPFRRNLSYFGVDLDQMLSSRPDISRKLLHDVLEGFERGDFAPLPYTVFDHADIVEAMRLMQQSGHVGKVLVRPPPPERAPNPSGHVDFKVDPDRTHLITGGLGGFGVETARWLVERGARRLVLIGRSGASNEHARQAIAGMRAKGIEIRIEALDIADRKAAEDLFTRLKREAPPLAGVIHAAMVLDDAIVANTDEPRLLKVLRPKVAGAENLDRLTRDLSLDYFVLFSSATTMIGNPGQGAYVAANGFLEGLARRRRLEGLPALAIAWGAIADAGVLQRSVTTRDAIEARAGVKGMPFRMALDLMAQALAFDGGPSGDGVIAIADMNWSVARSNLKVLISPSYNRLVSGFAADESQSRGLVDLQGLVQRLSPEDARRAIAEVVIEELARILRLPREEVSKSKHLSEIGVDSLMAVELTLALEARLGLQASLGEAAGPFNVMELAARILSSQAHGGRDSLVSESLAARHLEDAERGAVVELIGRLEAAGSNASLDLTGSADQAR
jgi:phthiocerol/phenolphthiocerol synthesis type-I polyketide synthase C